uniref:Uncharacterized protein n=1 Tax=Arundo donax TaxID=35708 RepID=A0A0A9C7J9_ARUDO
MATSTTAPPGASPPGTPFVPIKTPSSAQAWTQARS